MSTTLTASPKTMTFSPGNLWSAAVTILIDPSAPQRAKSGSGITLAVPGGISMTRFYLPLLTRQELEKPCMKMTE